jgi:hypothetical protein
VSHISDRVYYPKYIKNSDNSIEKTKKKTPQIIRVKNG